MGYLLTISCYILSFSSSLVVFCSFVAHDPVRIILFFLGAFFWLCSLLISSLVWLALSSFIADAFIVSLFFCIIAQELSRVAYFMLLKKAQKGLNKITSQGDISVAPGVSDLHNARHMLALVCGLGMGVISALFFTMNAFAAFSGPGTIGLPEALVNGKIDSNRAGKYLPLFYSLSALMLTIFHVNWTIMVWDTCHKFGRNPAVFIPGAAAVVSHLFIAFLSSLNSRGYYIFVLSIQFLVLLISFVYCNAIMGGTMKTLMIAIGNAIFDTFTMKDVRNRIAARQARRRQRNDIDEPLRDGHDAVAT